MGIFYHNTNRLGVTSIVWFMGATFMNVFIVFEHYIKIMRSFNTR